MVMRPVSGSVPGGHVEGFLVVCAVGLTGNRGWRGGAGRIVLTGRACLQTGSLLAGFLTAERRTADDDDTGDAGCEKDGGDGGNENEGEGRSSIDHGHDRQCQ